MINLLKTIFILFVLGVTGFIILRDTYIPYEVEDLAVEPRETASYLDIDDEILLNILSKKERIEPMGDISIEQKMKGNMFQEIDRTEFINN